MPVYDDQKRRGSTGHLPDDDNLRRRTGINADEEAEMEKRAYDEQAAGISSVNTGPSSNTARDILQREREAAKGNVGPTIGAPSSAAASPTSAGGKSDKGSKGSDTEPTDNETKRGLFKQEEGGGLYRKEEAKHQKKGVFKLAGIAINTKKRIMIMLSSLIVTIATTVASFFAAILPFQLPSITQFLEDFKYAAINNASDKAMEHMFTSYLKNVLFPGMRANGCPSTKVDKRCVGVIRGDGPVTLLYNKFSGRDKGVASIESKLANRGIEIQMSNGRYFLRSPSLGNPIPLDDVQSGRVSNIYDMKEVSRADVRAEMRRAFEEEGDYKKLFYRMRVGNFLKKYGIIRCMAACDFKDKAYGKYQDKKYAGLAYFNRRIIEPRSELLSLYVNCLLTPCSDELRTMDDEATNGEPMDDIRRESRNRLSAYSAKYGSDKLEELVKKVENLNRDGLSLHLTRMAVEKIGGSVDKSGKIDPGIVNKVMTKGHWIILVLRLLVLLYDAAQLKTMNYALNAAAGVAMFEMARTASHEARSNHMDATMLGSMTNLFRHGAFNSGPGLEESPIYEKTFTSAKATPTAAFMQSLLPAPSSKVHAQPSSTANNTQSYMCTDDRSIYQHQTTAGAASNAVCDEMRLSYANLATKASDLFRLIPGIQSIIGVLKSQLALLDALLALPTEVILGILKLIPIIGGIVETIEQKIGGWIAELLQYFMKFMMKDMFGDRTSGARNMEIAILGAEVGGADAAHRVIGGQVLKPNDITRIQEEEQTKRQDAFAAMPLRDRLFSMDSTYSLTSQIALNVPSDPRAAAQRSFASLLSNPLEKLASSFASVFALRYSAYAAPSLSFQASAFDVVQHGYPANHPFFKTDPLVYWEKECKDGLTDKAYNLSKDVQEVEFTLSPVPIPGLPITPGVPKITDPALVARARIYGYEVDDRSNQVINANANPCFMINSLSKYDEPPAAPAGTATPATPPGQTLNYMITGYTWQDNTPPGSAIVCCSVLHPTADGQGTFDDPITTAVPGSGSSMENKPGTKFYVPHIKRYVIVEDSGASPTASYNNGAVGHLDIWVDGRDTGNDKGPTDACAAKITGLHPVEINPPAGREVTAGPIYKGGCNVP